MFFLSSNRKTKRRTKKERRQIFIVDHAQIDHAHSKYCLAVLFIQNFKGLVVEEDRETMADRDMRAMEFFGYTNYLFCSEVHSLCHKEFLTVIELMKNKLIQVRREREKERDTSLDLGVMECDLCCHGNCFHGDAGVS